MGEKKKLTFFNLVKNVILIKRLRKSLSDHKEIDNKTNHHQSDKVSISKTNSLPLKISYSDTNIYFQDPSKIENCEPNVKHEYKRSKKFTSLKIKKNDNLTNSKEFRVIAQCLYTYSKMGTEKTKLPFFNLVKNVILIKRLRKSLSDHKEIDNRTNHHQSDKVSLSKTNSLPLKISYSDTNIYFKNPTKIENCESNIKHEYKRSKKFTSLKKNDNLTNSKEFRENSSSTFRKLSVKHLKKSASSVKLNQSLPNIYEESVFNSVGEPEISSELIVDCLDSTTFQLFEHENTGCDIEFIEISFE